MFRARRDSESPRRAAGGSRPPLYCSTYLRRNGIEAPQHLRIRKAKDDQTIPFENAGTTRVVRLHLLGLVMPSVDFNDNPRFGTIEVDDVVIDRALTEKSWLACSEYSVPEFSLCRRHPFAQRACSVLQRSVVGESVVGQE